MLNQTILVGRIAKEIELKEEQDKKIVIITLAVPRSFKNEQGVYETDFIPCILYKGIAENVLEYCKKGDLVGIKGRIQNLEDNNLISIVAEKITFLSSKKESEEK